jgi:hypothetical protein
MVRMGLNQAQTIEYGVVNPGEGTRRTSKRMVGWRGSIEE